jgi:hypothetical protein
MTRERRRVNVVAPGLRRAGRCGALAALVTLTLAAIALANSAPIRWSPPQLIIASEPNVPTAINGAGQAITLRPTSAAAPAVQLITASGRVRTDQLHSAVGGFDAPSVAIAGNGALAVVWDTDTANFCNCDTSGGSPRVEVAFGTFSHPPTTATVLPGSDASAVGAYETPGGSAFVLWSQGDALDALVMPAGSSAPSAPITLDSGASLIGAGVDGAGELVVIESTRSSLVEQRIATTGSVSAPKAFGMLSPAGANLGALIDGAGDQLFYWSKEGSHQQLYARWRSATGVLGPQQTIGTSAEGASDFAPFVALNAAGEAVALLSPYGIGSMAVRFAAPLGSFGAPHPLGASDLYNRATSVSIDGSRRSLVTWVDSAHADSDEREVYAEAHGTTFGSPAPLAVQAGYSPLFLATAVPLASASPTAAQIVVTYAGWRLASKGWEPIGQIAFPQD